ncbi:MAG: histidine phosphatase family protein [Rhizobacter sp.]|nr:histidine phosphatase family protein [Chlorobiales bacterium]
MKTLYLVRHAKSSWKDELMDDFERPLNARGRRDAPVIASVLRRWNISPDLILASPANRAITTARIFAKVLGYAEDRIVTLMTIYDASPLKLIEIVQQIETPVEQGMLFGHNTALTETANLLTNASIENIPTCGVVAVDFDLSSWKDVRKGSGTVKFAEFPKTYFPE